MVRTLLPANLAISTYLKDGFTPTAIASDSQGNIYLAGSAVIDAVSETTGAVVAKLDPKATQYLYLVYLDSAAGDQVSAIAIDSSGNAYVTGWTTNPNFPAFGGGALGTAPAGSSDTRSFITKLNPQGVVVFSVLLGGSAKSTARGIALTPQGQILVSGIAGSSGFRSTPGAYNVADSTNQWFLMELDAAAAKTIFSATGIGGRSIALDAAGNIYMAGSSIGTDYPTTPGAYQTTLVQGSYCFGFCRISFPGVLQHVTKVDPAGSKLIYSTGLNDITGFAGSTTNTGLAVDAAGNAYVTGTLFQAEYPFTVTSPTGSTGYLTKLDPTGANALFSVPVGGGGVQLDSSGSVYVGGTVISIAPFLPIPPAPPVALPSVFSWLPKVCQPNFITAPSEAYVMKVDPATGTVRDAQWIDGSAPGATGITLAGGKVWITGPTPGPEVPFSPGVLTPQNLGPGFLEGAYLSAVDFPGGVNNRPVIACVLDAGNLTHVGAVAPFQLISIFGANLGPAAGVAAPDGTELSTAGVSVTFDGQPAQVLYASASQINVAVPEPAIPASASSLPSATVMQVTVNGSSVERQFPITASNLNLFADLSSNQISCPNAPTAVGFQPLATNADGSLNSCTNPARFGSTVSFFVHGVGGFGSPPPQLLNLQASVGPCSAAVTNASLIDGFVYKVDVSLPASPLPCIEVFGSSQVESYFAVALSFNGAPVGPLFVPADAAGPVLNFSPPGIPMPMIVWVK
ncbi:MAG: SBBP repeat-containing protein [Acidobacteriia bacterium]|nr:SBBP repeat-containing protein [Terriglobia bacterium]